MSKYKNIKIDLEAYKELKEYCQEEGLSLSDGIKLLNQARKARTEARTKQEQGTNRTDISTNESKKSTNGSTNNFYNKQEIDELLRKEIQRINTNFNIIINNKIDELTELLQGIIKRNGLK